MSDESVLDVPEGPLKEAYRCLNDLYVKTRRHGAALEVMQRLFRASRHTRSHQGFALLGESGAGKTTTVRQFETWLRQQLRLTAAEATPLPIITMTALTTPKDLLAAVLDAYGDPMSSSGTRSQLAKRFEKVASHRPDIVGVAFDEAHHAFEAKSGKDKVLMAQTLKDIVSACPKPLIAMGPMSLEHYLDVTDGMPMRFEQREFLEDMRLDLTDDLQDLRSVLKAMDELLPTMPGWSLDSAEMLKRLYLASQGSFGRIVSLVRRACRESAFDTGVLRVGPAHFSAAWRLVAPRKQRKDKYDPFKLDIATVTTLAAQLCTKLRGCD